VACKKEKGKDLNGGRGREKGEEWGNRGGRVMEEEQERRRGEGGKEQEGGRVRTVKEAQSPEMKMYSAAYGRM
jgi:hypothetical protein